MIRILLIFKTFTLANVSDMNVVCSRAHLVGGRCLISTYKTRVMSALLFLCILNDPYSMNVSMCYDILVFHIAAETRALKLIYRTNH